jgi:hypothetical protein
MGPEELERDRLTTTIKSEKVACELLGADFSAHEDDIGDAEADCH